MSPSRATHCISQSVGWCRESGDVQREAVNLYGGSKDGIKFLKNVHIHCITDLVYLELLISAVLCLALHLHTPLQATTAWASLGREFCLGVEQSNVNKPGCGVFFS